MNTFKILIIDDDTSILNFLSSFLSGKGYSIDTAEDGEQGINKIEFTDYNLVITDLIMPGLSGEYVAYHLKDVKEKETPIIGMSGTPWLMDKTLFDGVLVKPFSTEILLNLVNDLIGKT